MALQQFLQVAGFTEQQVKNTSGRCGIAGDGLGEVLDTVTKDEISPRRRDGKDDSDYAKEQLDLRHSVISRVLLSIGSPAQHEESWVTYAMDTIGPKALGGPGQNAGNSDNAVDRDSVRHV